MPPNGGKFRSIRVVAVVARIASRPLITSLCLCVWLASCSASSGLLFADVTRAKGAWVVDIKGCCASLRTVADDAGVSLGYDRRIYIYPIQIGDPPREGRHYFTVQLPQQAPVALNNRAIGVDVRATGLDLGITLGYRDTTLLARVPDGESVLMQLHFIAGQPNKTRLTYCKEEDPCWPIDLPDAATLRR